MMTCRLRSYPEFGVQRYPKTVGDTMPSRGFSGQEQESMITSGALNKMTILELPQGRRSV